MSGHPEEKRQMGALGLVVSNRKDAPFAAPQTHVYLIKDKATIETAAGSTDWSPVPKRGWRWGIPGGGRKDGEVIHETLSREFDEEVGIQFDGMEASGVQRLIYPFLVGQWRSVSKGETSVPQIDMFAVAGVSVFFDALGHLEQNILEALVRQQQATWISLKNIASIFEATQSRKMGNDEFRPQVLTAAYLHYLGIGAYFSQDQFARTLADVKTMNMVTHDFLLSHTDGYTVNNGTFAANGTLKNDLSVADEAFLFGDL